MHKIVAFEHMHHQLLLALRHYGTSAYTETYYDILKVDKDCSEKDIRKSFVQLSKQFHPDVNQMNVNFKDSSDFVKITEAYRVLSKPKSRLAYDRSLAAQEAMGHRYNAFRATEFHRPWEIRPDIKGDAGPYYGIKGLKRMPNSRIALALIAIGVVGAIFGFASVKQTFILNNQKQEEESAKANLHHASVRMDAVKYGNQEQLRRITERLSADKGHGNSVRIISLILDIFIILMT